MIDITDNSQLKPYLAGKNLFQDCGSLRFHLFSGGVSGNVVLASDGKTSLIVKQALPKLKVKENWECDPSRLLMEHKALEVYARITPENVPKPVFYDMENHIMVRQAAPEDCSNWKEDLLSGRLDFNVARKAAEALARVHNEAASDEEIRQTFWNNKVFYDLRVNPYIEWVVAEKHPELKESAAPVIDMLMNKKITLVHGDYSPKNILVSGKNIFILDMEVAHMGHPAFDLAFFFTMFVCKAVKNRLWAEAYLNMLTYMYNLYFREINCMNPDALRRDTLITLAFIILARIDGKSPAEYITEDDDKSFIRQFACEEIKHPSSSLSEMISRLRGKMLLRNNSEEK